MSRVLRGKNPRIVLLEPEPDGKCELCGKRAELRPYGPRGEKICFACGKKSPAVTERRMGQVLFGEGFDA